MADAVPAAPSSFRSWLPVRAWLSLRGWQQAAIGAALLWLVGDTAQAILLPLPGGRLVLMAGLAAFLVCVFCIGHDVLKYLLDAIVAKGTLDRLMKVSPEQREDFFDSVNLDEARKRLRELQTGAK